jgi:hypothetical protein
MYRVIITLKKDWKRRQKNKVLKSSLHTPVFLLQNNQLSELVALDTFL